MARKNISDETKKQLIILLAENKEKKIDIARRLGISYQSIRNYEKKYAETIAATQRGFTDETEENIKPVIDREEMTQKYLEDTTPKENKEKEEEYEPPEPEEPEEEPENEPEYEEPEIPRERKKIVVNMNAMPKKPQYQSVEEETIKKTIKKASDSVSSLKAVEIKEDYQAAQILHTAAVKYKNNVEFMGLPWTDFIMVSLDEMYKQAVDIYKEKIAQELLDESLLKMEMEDKLENPEPEEPVKIEEIGEENE